MKKVFVFLLGIALSFTINVFAIDHDDSMTESHSRSKNSDPDARISEEYSKDENKANATQSASKNKTTHFTDNDNYSTSKKQINKKHSTENQTAMDSKKSYENKMPESSKTVAEEANPNHAMDENKQ